MTTPDARPSWFRRHRIAARLLALLLAVLLAEVLCRALVGLGYLPYHPYPTTREPRFWDDLSPSWGVWHLPDATLHHVSTCFDVVYRSNGAGMRDRDRTLTSTATRRVVVLGDSFVEGYGVADGARMTDRLEESSGVEHLDFGCAGDFSTVQQWLLYRDLASSYDHTEVMVFVLPFNDARENDPARFPADRYRPYLVRGESGELEVRYPVPFEERHRERRSDLDIVKNTAANWFYLYNVARRVVRQLRSDPDIWLLRPGGEPSYDSYDDDDVASTLYALDEIAEIAGDRTVHLFTIPTLYDFEAGRNGRTDFRVPRELRAFAAARENVDFTDLLPAFVEHAREHGHEFLDYVLPCDGHWNARGHRVAADAVAAAMAGR